MDRNSVSRLLLGLYGNLREDVNVVMIRACIDEASSHWNDPKAPMLLYGTVSTVGAWSKFDPAWGKTLRKYEVPYAHAKELYHGEGPFKNWPDKRKLGFALRQDRIIKRRVEFCFCVSLDKKAFKEYRKTTALSSILMSDYGVCIRIAYSFLQLGVPFLFKAKSHDVFVVIENGHPKSGSAVTIHKEMQAQVPGCLIKSVAFADKKDCYGLQASDSMAFATLLLEERSGAPNVTILDTSNLGDQIREFAKDKKPPVFRLPVDDEILTELKDGAILSKRTFMKRFSEHLSSSARSS